MSARRRRGAPRRPRAAARPAAGRADVRAARRPARQQRPHRSRRASATRRRPGAASCQLLSAGRIRPGQIVTHRFALARLRRGVRGARSGGRGARQGDARDHQPPTQPLSRPSGSLSAGLPGMRAQEVEVAALDRPAARARGRALRSRARRRGRAPGVSREAALDLGGRDVQVDAPRLDVEHDRDRRRARRASGPPAADSGATCSTTVPNAVPLMRASETRTMSVTPWASSFFGIGTCPHSGMPGPPRGPELRSTSTVSARDVERRIVDARLRRRRRPRTRAPGRDGASSAARGGALLDHRAARREAAAQDGETALRGERLGERRDHGAVERLRVRVALLQRLAGDGRARRRAAAGASSLSTACTPPARCRCSKRCSPEGRRLPITGVRRDSSSKRSSVSGTPRRPGEREQVDDGVRPAAERHQQRDGVVERLRRDDLRRGAAPRARARPRERRSASAARMRAASTAGIVDVPGRHMPSASTSAVMVEAVPSSLQCPNEGVAAASSSANAACDIRPARSSSA